MDDGMVGPWEFQGWEKALPAQYPAGIEMPRALEVEKAFLGVLLMDPRRISQVSALLATEDLYLEIHRWIYDGLKALGAEADILSLDAWLAQRGVAERSGGIAYLTSLDALLPDPEGLVRYAEILKDRSWRRRGIELAQRMARVAAGETRTAQEILTEGLAGYQAILAETRRGGGFRDAGTVLEEWMTAAEERENRPPEPGLSAGIGALDEIVGGMERKHMWLLGARPGVGKTSFLLQIAGREAIEGRRHVAIFSLEMDDHELMLRIAGQRLGLETRRARRSQLTSGEWANLITFRRELGWLGTIHVDQQPRIDAGTIASRLQDLASRVPLSAVFVDYLTLVKARGGAEEKRYARVAEVAEDLAAVAKEMNLKMVVAAQLSRDGSKASRKPRLADLREAGEEPAWGVVLLHREEQTNEEGGAWLSKETEFIVAKNRTGDTGIARGFFHGPTQAFRNPV